MPNSEIVIHGLQYARSPTSMTYFNIIFPAYPSLFYSISAVKGVRNFFFKVTAADNLSQFTSGAAIQYKSLALSMVFNV